MIVRIVRLTLLPLLMLACLLPAGTAPQEKKQRDEWSAVAVGAGGAIGGSSIQFDFHIDQYTTDAEVKELAALLKDKGQDALRRALEKLSTGRINAVGRTGNDIAVARKRQQGNTTIITIVTARTMPFIELASMSRTTDYPFGFLQATFNEKGEGAGKIMAAASIKFNKKKGEYQIESYGNQYIRVINVRPWK